MIKLKLFILITGRLPKNYVIRGKDVVFDDVRQMTVIPSNIDSLWDMTWLNSNCVVLKTLTVPNIFFRFMQRLCFGIKYKLNFDKFNIKIEK